MVLRTLQLWKKLARNSIKTRNDTTLRTKLAIMTNGQRFWPINTPPLLSFRNSKMRRGVSISLKNTVKANMRQVSPSAAKPDSSKIRSPRKTVYKRTRNSRSFKKRHLRRKSTTSASNANSTATRPRRWSNHLKSPLNLKGLKKMRRSSSKKKGLRRSLRKRMIRKRCVTSGVKVSKTAMRCRWDKITTQGKKKLRDAALDQRPWMHSAATTSNNLKTRSSQRRNNKWGLKELLTSSMHLPA